MPGGLTGSSGFLLVARGPTDTAAARCMPSISCTTRLMRYPLKQLSHSPAFDALPDDIAPRSIRAWPARSSRAMPPRNILASCRPPTVARLSRFGARHEVRCAGLPDAHPCARRPGQAGAARSRLGIMRVLSFWRRPGAAPPPPAAAPALAQPSSAGPKQRLGSFLVGLNAGMGMGRALMRGHARGGAPATGHVRRLARDVVPDARRRPQLLDAQA